MDNVAAYILVAAIAALMLGGAYFLAIPHLKGAAMKIDPVKQAERKARRAARREKVQEFGKGVRKGLANLDDNERANIKTLLLETVEDVKDVVVLLPKLAAMIASKKPDVKAMGSLLAEVQDVGEDLIALVKAVREGIED